MLRSSWLQNRLHLAVLNPEFIDDSERIGYNKAVS